MGSLSTGGLARRRWSAAGASLDGRLFLGGTDLSNPVPSSDESANFWFLSGGTVFLRYTYDEAERQPWVGPNHNRSTRARCRRPLRGKGRHCRWRRGKSAKV